MEKKVALVTGASAGIGEATALELHRLGFKVYAAARRVQKMKALAAQGIEVLAMDVTVDSALVEGVSKILKESGRLDVLVNNAGYGSYGSLEEVPLSEGRYQFDVNLFGLARLTQLVIPQMRKQASGTIVNVSSIGGKGGEPLGAWYHATKFAVEGLSDSIRLELKPFGIHVVVIEPGAIRTEWGGIAVEHLLQVSGSGPYATHAKKHALLFESVNAEGSASPPEVIAKVIGKAATSRRPKIRYVAGKFAKSAMFMRKILSDRAFDALSMSLYKNVKDK